MKRFFKIAAALLCIIVFAAVLVHLSDSFLTWKPDWKFPWENDETEQTDATEAPATDSTDSTDVPGSGDSTDTPETNEPEATTGVIEPGKYSIKSDIIFSDYFAHEFDTPLTLYYSDGTSSLFAPGDYSGLAVDNMGIKSIGFGGSAYIYPAAEGERQLTAIRFENAYTVPKSIKSWFDMYYVLDTETTLSVGYYVPADNVDYDALGIALSSEENQIYSAVIYRSSFEEPTVLTSDDHLRFGVETYGSDDEIAWTKGVGVLGPNSASYNDFVAIKITSDVVVSNSFYELFNESFIKLDRTPGTTDSAEGTIKGWYKLDSSFTPKFEKFEFEFTGFIGGNFKTGVDACLESSTDGWTLNVEGVLVFGVTNGLQMALYDSTLTDGLIFFGSEPVSVDSSVVESFTDSYSWIVGS